MQLWWLEVLSVTGTIHVCKFYILRMLNASRVSSPWHVFHHEHSRHFKKRVAPVFEVVSRNQFTIRMSPIYDTDVFCPFTEWGTFP